MSGQHPCPAGPDRGIVNTVRTGRGEDPFTSTVCRLSKGANVVKTLEPQQVKVRSALPIQYNISDQDPTDPPKFRICNPDPTDSCRTRSRCNSDPQDSCQ